MLALLVQTLIHFLMDVELTKYDTNISKFRCKLHEFSLQSLLKIGPIYPQVCLLFNKKILKCTYIYKCIIVLGV